MAQSGPEAAANTLLYCPNHTHLSSKGAHWKFSRFLLQNHFDCKHSSCFSNLIATFLVLNTLWDKLSKMGFKVFLQWGSDLHSWEPIILEERQLSDTLWVKDAHITFWAVQHLWFKVFCNNNWNQFNKMRSGILIQKRSDQAFLWQ